MPETRYIFSLVFVYLLVHKPYTTSVPLASFFAPLTPVTANAIITFHHPQEPQPNRFHLAGDL